MKRPMKPIAPAGSNRTDKARSSRSEGASSRQAEALAVCGDGALENPVDPARVTGMLAAKPELGNALLIQQFHSLGSAGEHLDLAATSGVLESLAKSVADGDLSQIEAVLVAQIMSLNSIFTRTASLANASQGADRSAALMQLALKAQANCRATVQALADLKFPRQPAVFARQANVAQGPQQVVNNIGVPQEAPPRTVETVPALPIGQASVVAPVPRTRTRKATDRTVGGRSRP